MKEYTPKDRLSRTLTGQSADRMHAVANVDKFVIVGNLSPVEYSGTRQRKKNQRIVKEAY